jgi:hypothetical protein
VHASTSGTQTPALGVIAAVNACLSAEINTCAYWSKEEHMKQTDKQFINKLQKNNKRLERDAVYIERE